MKKWRVVSISILACALAACTVNEHDGQSQQTEQSAPQVDNILEVQADDTLYTAPFTGIALAQPLEQRPFLVTINNHPQARPQSGIGAADIVYEMLAEGDVTRFLALFQSELPENIGPVRSARSYFIDIAKGLDSFYVAHGYSPEAQTMLQQQVVDHINGMQYDGTLFKRASHRVAPHNSYITSENILTGASQVNASMRYNEKVSYTFYEDQESVKIGEVANGVAVQYGNASFNSTYEYDEQRKTYARFSGGVATIDELNEQQVQVANILFFEMPHQIMDDKGRRHINIDVGGKAYIVQHGTKREVAWANRDGLLVAIEQGGEDVKLVPGKTWIHFVPTTPGLTSAVTITQ